jgi:hypothetical protein
MKGNQGAEELRASKLKHVFDMTEQRGKLFRAPRTPHQMGSGNGKKEERLRKIRGRVESGKIKQSREREHVKS